MLRTLSFWDGDKAAGRPALLRHAPDELLRRRPRQRRLLRPGPAEAAGRGRKVFQVYFTGCAGNVTAGKYNDGGQGEPRRSCATGSTPAMEAAWKATKRHAVDGVGLARRAGEAAAAQGEVFGEEESRKVLEDAKATKAQREQRRLPARLAEAHRPARSS